MTFNPRATTFGPRATTFDLGATPVVMDGLDRKAVFAISGSSNAKAKRDLGWRPAFATWREGFRRGL